MFSEKSWANNGKIKQQDGFWEIEVILFFFREEGHEGPGYW